MFGYTSSRIKIPDNRDKSCGVFFEPGFSATMIHRCVALLCSTTLFNYKYSIPQHCGVLWEILLSRCDVANRSGIAAGGGFYDVQPGTAARFCFKIDPPKVDFLGFTCLPAGRQVRQAETIADSDLQPIASMSGPTCSNTFVGGSCFHFEIARSFFLEEVLRLFRLAIFALYSRMCRLIFSRSSFVNGLGST